MEIPSNVSPYFGLKIPLWENIYAQYPPRDNAQA